MSSLVDRNLLDRDLENTANVFTAQCDTPGNIYYVLKALHYKEKTKLYCTVSVQNDGMKFCVESHKNFQGNAYLHRPMFSEWDLTVKKLEFRIGLVEIMEAINCLRSKTAVVKFAMRDEVSDVKDRRLYINVTDRKVKANISLPVYNAVNDAEFNFEEHEVRAKVFMEANTIKRVFQEIDVKENPRVTFTFEPEVCHVTTNEETLRSVTRFPRSSTEVIEVSCDEDFMTFHYKSLFIKRLKYATSNASRVMLTMNDFGMLCAQFYFVKVDRHTAGVEFFTHSVDDCGAEI